MPLNPDMQSMAQQLDALRQSQFQQTGMLAGAVTALQQTIQDLANATRLGAATAQQSGGTALQSLQYGAATAMGDVQAFGGALLRMTAPAGPPPDVTMSTMAMGGGMGVGGGVDVVHGAAVGALTLGSVAAGYGAFAMPFGRAWTGGRALGRAFMGVGARGAIGAAIGGGLAVTGVGALALGAGLAVEHVANTAIEHLGAVRDINAVMRQQMWRNAPFDPNINLATANYRGVAADITLDIANMRGFSAADATTIVGGGMELGLFQGAGGGAQGIRRRASELAEAVREVTRLLGTSMEESLVMMAEIKQVGFDPMTAPGVLLASRGMGRAAGFTGAEMHRAGMVGAQAFRGTGFDPTFGFNAAQSSLAIASDLTLRGAMPKELVASFGGREAMGRQMTENLRDFVQSPYAMLAALAGPDVGIDPQQVLDVAQERFAAMTPAQVMAWTGGGWQAAAAKIDPRIWQARQAGLALLGARRLRGFEQLTPEAQGRAIAGQAQVMGLARNVNEANFLANLAQNPQTFESQAQAIKAEAIRDAEERYLQDHGMGAWLQRNIIDNAQVGVNTMVNEVVVKPTNSAKAVLDDAAAAISNHWYGVRKTTITQEALEAATERTERGRLGIEESIAGARAALILPGQLRTLGFELANIPEWEESGIHGIMGAYLRRFTDPSEERLLAIRKNIFAIQKIKGITTAERREEVERIAGELGLPASTLELGLRRAPMENIEAAILGVTVQTQQLQKEAKEEGLDLPAGAIRRIPLDVQERREFFQALTESLKKVHAEAQAAIKASELAMSAAQNPRDPKKIVTSTPSHAAMAPVGAP